MNPIPSPVDGISIERDLQRDLWRLRISDQVLTLRPWTWGERRRLVEFACTGAVLNRGAFVNALLDLLLDAAPPENMRPELALACMYLLGIPETPPAVSLARAEFLLAAAFGWPPQQLSTQPAADIDRLVQQVQPVEAANDGWTHIIIVDAAQNTSVEARLEAMFHAIALWAGLMDVSTEPASAPPIAAMRDATAQTRPVGPGEAVSEPAGRDPREHPKLETTFPGTARLSRPPDVEVRRRQSRGLTDSLTERPLTSKVRDESEIDAMSKPPRVAASSPPNVPSSSAGARREVPDEGGRHAETSRPDLPHPDNFFGQRPAGFALRGATFSPPVFPRSNSAGDVYDRPGRSQSASTLPDSDFFPAVRINVQWPDGKSESGTRAEPSSPPAALPQNPFALSEFEEQLADALDRAAREAGVDIP